MWTFRTTSKLQETMMPGRTIGYDAAFRLKVLGNCMIRLPISRRLLLIVVAGASFTGRAASAEELVLDSRMHHVRHGVEREWSEFPAAAEAAELVVEFKAAPVGTESTLRLRHRDVKQNWSVELNGRVIGKLPVDENSMVTFYAIPAGTLQDGVNRLRVFASGKNSDDVMLGDVRFDDRPRQAVLAEAELTVTVTEGDTGRPIPARITIVDESDSLTTTGAASTSDLAVRPGIVFTASGAARVPLPAGKYTVYAGHGFEYSVDRAVVDLSPGDTREVKLSIRREVPTTGYAACDTHVHTFTHSRHGDATIEERMVTLAAEGIELPVATDHNVQIDYRPQMAKAGVAGRFTPIVGNEVTTPLGHFNVFPIDPAASPIDHRGRDWPEIFDAIYAAKPHVVILNHARDIHSGFRPFDPQHHIGIAGERLDGRELRANAMELVNSGTTQGDGLQLVYDWFGLLNRGHKITPVGGSDSHDVGRHFVGQGRTYVRCDDDNPGNIDLDEVYRNFAEGRVSVSYGLLADIKVNGKFGPGDLIPPSRSLYLLVTIGKPKWTQVDKITYYQNGLPIHVARIAKNPDAPIVVDYLINCPQHDFFLSAVAVGPGVKELYWPTPKPYQPKSPDWTSYVMSVTGAVWIDADGDGKFTCAYEYAKKLFAESRGQTTSFVKSLAEYDESVAIQAASVWVASGKSLFDADLDRALRNAAPQVRRGFEQYTAAWKRSQEARATTSVGK